MKFWEAMKLLEEGKKVKHSKWVTPKYIQSLEGCIVDDELYHYKDMAYKIFGEWEIYEEPPQKIELTWEEIKDGIFGSCMDSVGDIDLDLLKESLGFE